MNEKSRNGNGHVDVDFKGRQLRAVKREGADDYWIEADGGIGAHYIHLGCFQKWIEQDLIRQIGPDLVLPCGAKIRIM